MEARTKMFHMAGSKRRMSFCSIVFVVSFCSFSYLLGVWHNGGSGGSSPAITTTTSSVLHVSDSRCSTNNSDVSRPFSLDFSAHHAAEEGGDTVISAKKTYPVCDQKYNEYTPCEDPKRSLRFERRRLIYRERHCPKKSELLKCRVPAPPGYRTPFRWPASRDFAWYANAPHKHLAVEKANQNWIISDGDRFRFPGGGTMFPDGADAYINDIGKLINLNGGDIRTAIDTGCGVASWGAYLLSRGIITTSFAPKDTHEAQVQFALERGVPALLGVMASRRLPYPSRAFDMAHCSRCLIPWGQYDGVFLMEVDRVLRPGGYWILSGPPINWKKHSRGWMRTKQDLISEQSQIERIAKSLCWRKLVEKGDIAVWQKPINHVHCSAGVKLLCAASDDPDKAWYAEMQTCLTRLPEVGNASQTAGGKLENWPARLHAVPPRISAGKIEGISANSFREESSLWKRRVSYYKTVSNQLALAGRYRNILDMNAGVGGFAAAQADDPVWVMNVVPIEAAVNTLGVIYERGLIGTYHSWCEAMSTYPRTYDLIHADSIFPIYENRCDMEDVLLEMDRVLRPEGSAIFRDDVDVLVKVKAITDGLNWDGQIVDHEDGPMEREKILFAVKSYWTAPASSPDAGPSLPSPKL